MAMAMAMAMETRQRINPPEEEGSEPLPKKLLPDDIIPEILCRLPVRSLLQFRCVCKSWRDLISDAQFVESHLKFSSENENDDRIRIVTSTYRHPYHLKSFSLFSVLYERSVIALEEPDYPSKDPGKFVRIVGCCNGLVCIVINSKEHDLYEEADIFLWNPATRKSIRLPKLGMTSQIIMISYGFGYDEVIDDYVVAVAGNDESSMPMSMVMVYTRRTRSWRRIQNFTNRYWDKIVISNGALHWSSYNEIDSFVIVSLDLRTETYGVVAQSNYGDDYFYLTLGVLGGCLCVLCQFKNICSDIWIMKEYGIRESWCKLVTIPCLAGYGQYLYCAPSYISKNGDFLLQLGSTLVIYNSEVGTFGFPNLEGCSLVNTYIESLVSPTID